MTEKIKVLMVDDELQFRETTRKILSNKGFDTLLAASGEEAILQLEQKPDVVILDIRMPGLDGLQTLKRIKQQYPDVAVIMLTGHGDKTSAEDAFRAGAFDYLAKPCDIDILAARIADAVRRPPTSLEGDEKSVLEVMIPMSDYTTIGTSGSVREAIEKLQQSFSSRLCTSRLMETGHRSVLVLDNAGDVVGIVSIAELLEAVMPAYISAPKPSTADSMEFSPLFWRGMYNRAIKTMAGKKVEEIMSPRPKSIQADANLMETAYVMINERVRRLVVLEGGRVAGVIREQDLFFEMVRILLNDPPN